MTKEQLRTQTQEEKETKLFLSGDVKKLKNAEVRKYFGCFGKVKDVKLMPNKTGSGMGFVIFASQQPVSKVLEHAEIHTISGIEVFLS